MRCLRVYFCIRAFVLPTALAATAATVVDGIWLALVKSLTERSRIKSNLNSQLLFPTCYTPSFFTLSLPFLFPFPFYPVAPFLLSPMTLCTMTPSYMSSTAPEVELRKRIREIQDDDALEPAEKAQRIQRLMSGGHTNSRFQPEKRRNIQAADEPTYYVRNAIYL